jgi:hypothetical protein
MAAAREPKRKRLLAAHIYSAILGRFIPKGKLAVEQISLSGGDT